ncbi:MAG TPA: MBL fold metallo-hydrolase [Candidatus Paceibacterota bacterium]
MRTSSINLAVCLLALAALTGAIWYAALEEEQNELRVSFLDVGQGDAIYIEAPGGRRVLIDGGSGPAVLRALGDKMSWWDRSLDLVVATHPDNDHIGGLIDVLERYRVSRVVHSSVQGETDVSERFRKLSALSASVAQRGQIVELGGGARLEILFPDREVPHVEANTGCVVARLVYGETAFMLSCDAPSAVEEYLVRLASTPLGTSGGALKSNVLKAGHHGSKTSSSPLFLGYVDPEYAVFSRGCDNTYGHPSPEVVATYARFEIPTFDTCTEGTITFVSDGQEVRRQ